MIRPFLDLTPRGRALRLRRLALQALQRYDLNVFRLKLVDNSSNGIFRVDTLGGDRWILRVTLPEGGHTCDHVAAEMDWLAALARDTCLSVPRPLAARNGAWVVDANAEGVPEPRLCVIFSWVPGVNLADRLSEKSMFLLGELSARLHAHARTYLPPQGLDLLAFDRVFPFPEPVVLFEEPFASALTPAQREVYQQAEGWAQQAIERLQASGEPMRILHNDLHQWNVRYFRGVLSPIDFEDLMWGWPVQDIATTLYYFQDEPDYATMRQAFQQGYQTVNPWPERYPGEIDAFIAARGLGMLNFVFQNNALINFDLAEFAHRIEQRLSRLLNRADFYLRFEP